MTPGARVAAAIEVLDAMRAGTPAEKALLGWARGHRFAGSKDRAAIRDHVFDALRCRRSYAALGGGDSGRALMLGALHARGEDPATLFDGAGHAPPPPGPDESRPGTLDDPLAALDCPDWLADDLQASLGADFAPVMRRLQERAPVFLRVNLLRTDPAGARAALAEEGIGTRPGPLSDTALEVTEKPRAVARSAAYRDGLVELQDAASQAIVDRLPLPGAGRILDYCAGGGGKSLAMAARAPGADLHAHDIDAGRMSDLPARAARAGCTVTLHHGGSVPGAFDLVLADAPCSGSGAWRRSPEGKWSLNANRLHDLLSMQDEVLDAAVAQVAPGGRLAYATCSLLQAENRDRVEAFLARHPGWRLTDELRLTPLDGGDGFYLACLDRA